MKMLSPRESPLLFRVSSCPLQLYSLFPRAAKETQEAAPRILPRSLCCLAALLKYP